MNAFDRAASLPGYLWRAYQEHTLNEFHRRRLRHVHMASGVIVRGSERITAGRRVFFDHRSSLNCNTEAGFITLGDNVEIGPYSILWGGGGITIGNNVHIGTHVHITSMEGEQISADTVDPFTPLEIIRSPVVIGDHVLIFARRDRSGHNHRSSRGNRGRCSRNRGRAAVRARRRRSGEGDTQHRRIRRIGLTQQTPQERPASRSLFLRFGGAQISSRYRRRLAAGIRMTQPDMLVRW